MSEAPPLKKRPIWNTETSVEPKAAIDGSTSVACWLVGLVNVSVLSRRSNWFGGGGGALEPPLSPAFELEFDPPPQPTIVITSDTAHANVAMRARCMHTTTRLLGNPKLPPLGFYCNSCRLSVVGKRSRQLPAAGDGTWEGRVRFWVSGFRFQITEQATTRRLRQMITSWRLGFLTTEN